MDRCPPRIIYETVLSLSRAGSADQSEDSMELVYLLLVPLFNYFSITFGGAW